MDNITWVLKNDTKILYKPMFDVLLADFGHGTAASLNGD